MMAPENGRAKGATMADREFPHDLVVLVSVWQLLEGELIVSRLQAAGIPAVLRSESVGTVVGVTVDGLGRRDVLVRAEDLERARAELEPGEEEEPEGLVGED
jgi:hypothetical protein